MPILENEFKAAKNEFPYLEVYKRDRYNQITVVKCQIKGIRGGRGPDCNNEQWYTVVIDVSSIRAEIIPDVWVLNPPDENIRHVNIFKPSLCPQENRYLPSVCFGIENKESWEKNKQGRNLLQLLKITKKILSEQNFGSVCPGR